MSKQNDISQELAKRIADRPLLKTRRQKSALQLMRRVFWVFAGLLAVLFYLGGDRQKGSAVRGFVLALLGLGVSYLLEKEFATTNNRQRPRDGDNENRE
jgi:hypothetical protein